MNLPNRLSLFRVILVPVIVFLYLYPTGFSDISVGNFVLSFRDFSVFMLFVIASITDFLDGYIARKYRMVTSFGKFIDPIADKLLVNTLFILLAYAGVISIVPVLIMIWRDMMVDGMRMMSAKEGEVVAAGIWGKAKTVMQMLSIIIALLLSSANIEYFQMSLSDIFVWIACLLSVYSGILYFNQMKKFILESK